MAKNDVNLGGEKDSGRGVKKGVFKAAIELAESIATTTAKQGDGYVQHVFENYETYRRVQEEGNKAKLGAQFVKKSHIHFLADWMKAQTRKEPIDFGLCHGVRRGKEQAWFRSKLDGAQVIGTDISETATQFEHTVQWDFHNENPEWEGRADFVYTNSWDHAYDPAKAFGAWVKCLKPGGWLFLDHTRNHLPNSSNALDPFGATMEAVVRMLDQHCGAMGRVVEILDRKTNPDYAATVIVFQRN